MLMLMLMLMPLRVGWQLQRGEVLKLLIRHGYALLHLLEQLRHFLARERTRAALGILVLRCSRMDALECPNTAVAMPRCTPRSNG